MPQRHYRVHPQARRAGTMLASTAVASINASSAYRAAAPKVAGNGPELDTAPPLHLRRSQHATAASSVKPGLRRQVARGVAHVLEGLFDPQERARLGARSLPRSAPGGTRSRAPSRVPPGGRGTGSEIWRRNAAWLTVLPRAASPRAPTFAATARSPRRAP